MAFILELDWSFLFALTLTATISYASITQDFHCKLKVYHDLSSNTH